MAVTRVHLNADVFMVCLNHALVTDKEEVMGLLIGEIDMDRVSHVSAVILLRRSDKRKDRVEISPEQLSDASTQAENLANQLNRPMRVLGWYHSHPHITVWPSHVDVQTQAMYQMMDEGFIGVIISVFNEEKVSSQGRIQLTCFQSRNKNHNGEPQQLVRVEIPIHIVPTPCLSNTCLQAIAELSSILCHEEEDTYRSASAHNSSVLQKFYNEAVFTKAICNISEISSVPLIHVLETRKLNIQNQLLKLEAEKQKLLKILGHQK